MSMISRWLLQSHLATSETLSNEPSQLALKSCSSFSSQYLAFNIWAGRLPSASCLLLQCKELTKAQGWTWLKMKKTTNSILYTTANLYIRSLITWKRTRASLTSDGTEWWRLSRSQERRSRGWKRNDRRYRSSWKRRRHIRQAARTRQPLKQIARMPRKHVCWLRSVA